jgi:uncharacterized protein (TIGR02118 family)
MVKLIFLCSRRYGITHERYVELLLDGHVPIALRHHPTLRKYVVNIVEAAPAHAPLDSIGELYFDTLADFRDRLYDSPEGRRVVEADVAGFMGQATAYVVEEQVVRRGPQPTALGKPSPGMKVMTCLRRAETVGAEAFLAHWRDHRTPRTPLGLDATDALVGYVRDVVTDRLSAHGPPWHGFETRYLHTGASDSAATANDTFVIETASYRLIEHIQKL